ncbi:hypothetical protein ACHAQD_006589 [Fusarium lateritium]
MPTTVIQSKEDPTSTPSSMQLHLGSGFAKALTHISTLADEYDDVSDKVAFIKFDMEEVYGLAQELRVRSVPTFFAFEDGELADRVCIAIPPALQKFVHDFCNKSREK